MTTAIFPVFFFFSTLLLRPSLTLAITHNRSIIIIGAGPSGIAAASKLLTNNFTNIKIIEAEDRIGGRVNSVRFKDAFVDLGAEFCDGQENNIVFDMVKEYNILKAELGYDMLKIYYSNGSELREDLQHAFRDFLFKFDADEMNSTEISLGEAFMNEYNSTFISKYGEADLNILREAIRLSEQLLISDISAPNWSITAAHSHFIQAPGNRFNTWNGHGFKTILDVMLKSYPDPSKRLKIDDKLILNTKVTKISVQNASILVTSDDSNIFTADHVIFTPSLGVLKANHETLFSPQLPIEKREAIDKLGFGMLAKIVMHFPEKWWNDDILSAAFLWSDKDIEAIPEEFKNVKTSDGLAWITRINSVIPAPGNNPNVLIAWIGGDLIPEIEKLPDDAVKKGVEYVFKKFFGKKYKQISPIGDILRSKWCTNENFRGAYSYELAEFYKTDLSFHKILSEPLEVIIKGFPSLLFAGEATNEIHYATVHGAMETGFREAQRIIDYYKNNKL